MTRIALPLFFLIIACVCSFSQSKDKIIRMEAIHDFPILTREGKASNRLPYSPAHVEEDLNALAGDDLNYTFHMAAAEGVFPGETGTYTVYLNTLTERDGECDYNVYVNDEPVGFFQQNPPTNEFTSPATLKWSRVEIPANAKIRIESNNWSNLLRHEQDFFEYARGRWTGIDFIPETMEAQTSLDSEHIGIFEKLEDIGPPDIPVKASYNRIEKAYYQSAAGKDYGISSEDLGYLCKTASGDLEMETLISLLGLNDDSKRKAGLMIRQSAEPDALFVACAILGDGRAMLQYRNISGSPYKQIQLSITDADMIQLKKKGAVFTMSAAKFGEEYERQSVNIPDLTGLLMAGFFVNSNSTRHRETARFSRVRLFEDITDLVGD